VNPAAARALQWTPADGIGHNLREYLAPAAQPLFDDYLARMRRNPTDSGLMLLVAKDGTEQIWSYRNVKLEGPGMPACVLGHAMDVTREVRTRRELREVTRQLAERDARHHSLVEASPVGICIDQAGTVRFANLALAQLFGSENPADLVGRPLAALVAPHEAERIGAYQTAVAQQLTGGRIEAEHVRRNGSAVWLERWSSVVAWEGQPAMLSTFVDVSDRKRLEVRLRQLDRIEAVGRLAGGVAHHVSNLMSVVLLSAELLMKEGLGKDDPHRRHAERIQRAGSRAAELAHQLLAFSQAQALQRTRLPLAQFLSGLAPRLRETVSDAVTLELTLDAEPWVVDVDRRQLEEAVLALAANAQDAMPHGGRLLVQAETVEIGSVAATTHPDLAPGCYAVLTVRDSGVGMPEEVRTQLFEPFFTTKPVGAGTGLALASVYGIVKQHQGSITVESRPDAGTTVRIYLPRVEEPSDPSPAVGDRTEGSGS